MCGVFGVIRPSGIQPLDEFSLDRIGEQLKHRGPDGSGFIRNERALLGMHRLSIMDPAHGWQPFWSEDGRWGVLGNGEIYNAADLRNGLASRGHRFETGSDIEVVPHLMEEFETGAFRKLRGMFALVVIDKYNDTVHLVRDRLGEKPLCYWEGNSALYFSSEQGALVKSGVVPLEIEHAQLPGYLLHGFTPEPESLIRGVRKVPAGHFLSISLNDGRLDISCYWDPSDAVGDRLLTNVEIADAIESAVISVCTSDVPVGIALSGGLDSSIVAAIASKNRSDLHAFTIGYSGNGMDESHLAQQLASRLGIPCITTIMHTSDVARGFAEVCSARDEPISDIAGPALSALPRAARDANVPVLLTGIGGDELFWGYDWTRSLAAWTTTYLREMSEGKDVRRARRSPFPAVRQAQIDWITGLAGLRMDGQLRNFMSDQSHGDIAPLPYYEFQPGYSAVRRALSDLCRESTAMTKAEFTGSADPNWTAAYYTNASNSTYLRVNSFVQLDRLSMANSIESRTPLADTNLLELVLSGRLRSVDHFDPPKTRLREIAAGLLPADVVNRPKRGFTPPVRDWAKAIWIQNHEALSAEACVELCGLPEQETRRWMKSPVTRTGRINQVGMRLLTLELWLRGLN